MSGMGVVRLGVVDALPEPSPVPLGWQWQQYGFPGSGDGTMVWSEPVRHALRYVGPDETRRALIARRRDARYRLELLSDGGLEVDTQPGWNEDPWLVGSRTRIWWTDAEQHDAPRSAAQEGRER